MLDNLHN